MGVAPRSPDGNAVDAATTQIQVSLALFSREAVLQTCHRYTGQYFVSVVRAGDAEVLIGLKPKAPGLALSSLASEFLNQLLDQQLRVELTEQTKALRENIVRQAFVEADLGTESHIADRSDTDAC